MKKEIIWNILLAILWGLQLAAEAAAAVFVWQLDMLPIEYLVVFLAVLSVIWGVSGLLLFLPARKIGSKAFIARRIIACVLAVLTIGGCVFVSAAAVKIKQTLSTITKPPAASAIVGVYVLRENAAKELKDASGYTFAVVTGYDEERTQQAIEEIENRLGKQIRTESYANVPEMIAALYQKEADAMILNSAYVSILEETEVYADFGTRTRVLHEIAIVDRNDPTENPAPSDPSEDPTDPSKDPTVPSDDPTGPSNDPSAPSEDPTYPSSDPTDSSEATGPSEDTKPTEPEEEIQYPTTPFILYLSGSDTRNVTLTVSRSDVNILVVVNPVTKQILMVNTPRDYYVPNPAGKGALDKLTHCGIYGINCSVQALSDLYGYPVDYYAQINFTGFETLVNAVGGVRIYSDKAFVTTHGWFQIEQGYNDLNGIQALCYARERYAFASGDNERGRNQMKILTAVFDKLSAGTVIANYAEILDSLQGMFVTNMSAEYISDFVKMQLSDLAQWNVLSYAVTGKGGYGITYSMPGQELYVMTPNADKVAYASELIGKVLAGEILSADQVK